MRNAKANPIEQIKTIAWHRPKRGAWRQMISELRKLASILGQIGITAEVLINPTSEETKKGIYYQTCDIETRKYGYLKITNKPIRQTFDVKGKKGNLRELINEIGHDVFCGCQSCQDWIPTHIKSNTQEAKK